MKIESLNKEEAIALCNIKTQWNGVEVKRLLSTLKIKSKICTDTIKVGDVFHCKSLGHPCMVIKTIENAHICLLMTTEPNTLNIILKCTSRFFPDSYITSTIVYIPKDSQFVAPYDKVREVRQIKKLYIQQHKKLFK